MSFQSFPSIPTMGSSSFIKSLYSKVSGFANSREINRVPCGSIRRRRRPFHGDVEQDEFQCATSHCLTSYYSVFVVRLAIMAMLAILIGLLTLLTWHFTRVYTTRSLESLAYGLRFELLQRPILRMWNIFNSTVEIATAQVKLSEYVIRRYSKPANQAEQVELYEVMRDVTWAMFASQKALNSITISYRNGFVQAFHRDHRSNNTFYIYSDLVNYSITTGSYKTEKNLSSSCQGWNDQSIQGNVSAIWYREPLDPITGVKIGKQRPIPPDDLINIAGLSQVPDRTASWHVVVSKYNDSPLLSAALPVWDPSNESIVAVVGVTTPLYSVGQLMKELVEFHSGHIYLTSQEGWLLATSANEPLLKNTTNGPKLMMAVDSKDRAIRMGALWLQRTYGNKFPPTHGHEIHVKNAKLDDELYYIDSFFLNLKRLPMVGVIIIPRKYIMGKVDGRAFKTLIILILASVCILFIGCICIFILTNGVSKEMNLRAELISHLDARRKAEASSNYKSQFLANMSHELRTPMAAVIGLLDILISDVDSLNNEQFANITQIRKCSTALLRLLNNILDLSKVESGKLVLEEAEFDLGRELEGLVDMFSVQCINHNVETVLDLSDDMPRYVQGDSARVVQIFANLISNSIKFTSSGYIILRGWCEDPNDTSRNSWKFDSIPKSKLRQHINHKNSRSTKNDNKVVLWFEVDDTGCGIDSSKWESVFESFEQADPSTTRLHGGTGLGLCIVRTLVNKMGGEIEVVKKEGPGTVMRLCLRLNTPVDGNGEVFQVNNFKEHKIMVLLALSGRMGRSIMLHWLQKNGVLTWEASEWNGLTQVLHENFPTETCDGEPHIQGSKSSIFVIIVDIGLLDLINTNIWREQLNFLDKYCKSAKFAWILNHDTSNSVKMELRSKGHLIMVNKPLYKAKMTQILEAAIKERITEVEKETTDKTKENGLHECLETDQIQYYGAATSDDSDRSRIGSPGQGEYGIVQDCLIDINQVNSEEQEEFGNIGENRASNENFEDLLSKTASPTKSLEGLHILLAEDTPVLQRVATIMLEKIGASVMAVGDGVQAVHALRATLTEEVCRSDMESSLEEDQKKSSKNNQPFDLILMDCQMPKMDGYEATKAIRQSETGTNSHIPIVALTAHAMSSDEAKCLEVGMDAYLTKPINCKLMVATILELTKRHT
ncbi:histidine kinase 1-like [Impatiens glandulifera]|uniref:histidine kinase 1-like n=1 Tax=Impatiens glandulifera TaxID=253017 RepID=UPI001FB0A643|nr:histidine kinase 1-like [Impatiens glandulifera]